MPVRIPPPAPTSLSPVRGGATQGWPRPKKLRDRADDIALPLSAVQTCEQGKLGVLKHSVGTQDLDERLEV